MILRVGQAFTNDQGHTWRVLSVYRTKVWAESVTAPGLTATIKRRELESWTPTEREGA